MGNIHRAYSSRKRGVQKGPETAPLEVEAAGDVPEDATTGVARTKRRDLALEGTLLFAGGHAGVDGVVSPSLSSSASSARIFAWRGDISVVNSRLRPIRGGGNVGERSN